MCQALCQSFKTNISFKSLPQSYQVRQTTPLLSETHPLPAARGCYCLDPYPEEGVKYLGL